MGRVKTEKRKLLYWLLSLPSHISSFVRWQFSITKLRIGYHFDSQKHFHKNKDINLILIFFYTIVLFFIAFVIWFLSVVTTLLTSVHLRRWCSTVSLSGAREILISVESKEKDKPIWHWHSSCWKVTQYTIYSRFMSHLHVCLLFTVVAWIQFFFS